MRKTPACKAMDTYFTAPLAKNKETKIEERIWNKSMQTHSL